MTYVLLKSPGSPGRATTPRQGGAARRPTVGTVTWDWEGDGKMAEQASRPWPGSQDPCTLSLHAGAAQGQGAGAAAPPGGGPRTGRGVRWRVLAGSSRGGPVMKV